MQGTPAKAKHDGCVILSGKRKGLTCLWWDRKERDDGKNRVAAAQTRVLKREHLIQQRGDRCQRKKGMRFIDIGTIKYYACLSIVGINFIYDTTKDKGFTNEYATQDLTFSKTVTGNQGSREKYSQFTVKISNAVAGTK